MGTTTAQSYMVLSLNCARGESSTYAVLSFVSRNKQYLILLLQEPWLNTNREPPPLSGFEMFTPSPSTRNVLHYQETPPGHPPPPLRAILDHLSARYAIRLVFAAADHPLQEYIGLTSRTIQQPWLSTRGIHNRGVHYPTLHRPMSLVARHLRAGDVLEDTHSPSPAPSPPFPISITHLEEPADGP